MIVHHCQNFLKEVLCLKILLLGIIIASTNAHALVECGYVAEHDENSVRAALASAQSECETMAGGGGKFYGSYSKVTKCIASNTAELVDSSFGVWQLVVGCNTCGAKENVIEVEDFKNACAEKCMLTDYQCVWQNGEWGGSLGAFPKVCSKIDSTATGAKNEKLGIRNEELGIGSLEFGVWSVEFGVDGVLTESLFCRGGDVCTVGTAQKLPFSLKGSLSGHQRRNSFANGGAFFSKKRFLQKGVEMEKSGTSPDSSCILAVEIPFNASFFH